LYGLQVESACFLPESVPVEGVRVDVEITVADIAKNFKSQVGADGIVHLNKNTILVKVTDLAFFLVQNGKLIVIDNIGENGEKEEALIRLYLLGPIFNLLLSQRAVLLLHSCCIGYKNNRCFVVAGDSGAGKSTLAGTSIKRDPFYLLSDDVSLIAFNSKDEPFVQPSLPRIKLLPDALKRLQFSAIGLEKLPVESNKYSFLAHSDYERNPAILDVVFVLQGTDVVSLGLERLKGKKKVSNILKHLFWINNRYKIGHRDIDFIQATKVAHQCETFLVCYNKQIHSPELIVEHLTSALPN
jgi:hypothetical protein